MLAPPEYFGVVEDGVYRCSALTTLNFAFLETLVLKTIISLNPDRPPKHIRGFCSEQDIKLVHVGLRPWRASSNALVLSEDLLQDSFNYVLNKTSYPILILDSTNAFVGALRRMLKWNYSSVVAEYRIFSGAKPHYMAEIFLEMIDLKCVAWDGECAITDDEEDPKSSSGNTYLGPSSPEFMRSRMYSVTSVMSNMNQNPVQTVIIKVPEEEVLPEWFKFQRDMWLEEQADRDKIDF
ncbi:putative tyrosine-protein phosphatase OCA1 [Yarrowia sp. C11]|nr:putative tyrosine-protein phosphatase OCA1 [Yarrowia sp. C11]KAG5370696.1 putative tyrosine-protein phosphatase OCA1 [Yarrowia sp. E02]